MAVFPRVTVFLYLLRGSLFFAGTGRSGLPVSFLSSLSLCALTQPRAACVRHDRACPPLVSQLSCCREGAQLLLGWCLPRQSTAHCSVSPALMPSFPAQTTAVPGNGSSGTLFQASITALALKEACWIFCPFCSPKVFKDRKCKSGTQSPAFWPAFIWEKSPDKTNCSFPQVGNTAI